MNCSECNKPLDRKGRNIRMLCRSCVNRFLKTGSRNPNWKGDNVGYRAIHSWVVRLFGKANCCEKCHAQNAKRYEWANISGNYLRDRSDWRNLCSSCHIKEHRRLDNWNKNHYLKRNRNLKGQFV